MAGEIREEVRPIIGKTFEGKYKLKSIGCVGHVKDKTTLELIRRFWRERSTCLLNSSSPVRPGV